MKVFVKDPEVVSKIWSLECDIHETTVAQLLYAFIELRKGAMGAGLTPCQIRLRYKQVDLTDPSRLKSLLSAHCGKETSSLSLHAVWNIGWSSSNCEWKTNGEFSSLCPICMSVLHAVHDSLEVSDRQGTRYGDRVVDKRASMCASEDTWRSDKDRLRPTELKEIEPMGSISEVSSQVLEMEKRRKLKKKKEEVKKVPSNKRSSVDISYENNNNNNINNNKEGNNKWSSNEPQDKYYKTGMSNIGDAGNQNYSPKLLSDLEQLIATAAKSTSIVFQLESLASLKRQGDISEDEYSKIKRNLINNYLH